jgi:pyruvate/2-oxoglutarate dehydrogenase complex dihydrolipoamide dehydrogenase (E3) component
MAIFQVNVGCVPKKLMFYAAEANDHVEDFKDFGFKGMEKQPFDWKLVFYASFKLIASFF